MEAVPGIKNYKFHLSLLDAKTDEILFLENNFPNPEESLAGNFALISHVQNENHNPSVSFSNWQIKGEQLHNIPEHCFGPVCFAHILYMIKY